MKKDDDPFIITRQPRATGDANERQMLDMIHDSMGIRTIIRRGADGSTVRCRTRAGFVEFVVEDPTSDTSEEEETAIFLETGSTQYPHANTINQYYGLSDGQGQWWFKTGVTNPWLGYIKDADGVQSDKENGKIYGKYGGGTPPANATLYDGMISPATSIPTVYANNSSWITAMLTKRKAMVTCPASMFSGKMRLFMQARYGALLSPDQNIQSNNANGVIVDGVEFSNLGSGGAGIVTTAENEHFILKISGTTATVYQLKPRKEHKDKINKLRAKLNDSIPPSDSDRDKIEAYIFAGSYVDSTPYGAYSGAFPSATSMVYGWSFNWNGTKADIISVETIGSGLDTHFQSTHHSVAITNWAVSGTTSFGFAASTISIEEWRDWRGNDHIFLPDYETGGRMYMFSLNSNYAYNGSGKFHCFYDRRSDLKTVSYSQSIGITAAAYYDTDADWPGAGGNHLSSAYITSYIMQGRRLVTSKAWSGYRNGEASFSVGAATYGGFFETGTCQITEKYHGMGCAAPAQTRAMKESIVSITSYGCGQQIDGWSGYCSEYLNEPYTHKSEHFTWTEEDLGSIVDVHVANETRVFRTAVIPFFDCCAVFIYERDLVDRGTFSVTRSHVTNYNYSNGSMAMLNVRYTHHFTGVELCSFGDLIGNDYFNDHTSVYSSESYTKTLAPLYSLYITHFHDSFATIPSEDESTLVTLFYVSSLYPYVDAQLWASVNAGSGSAYLPVYNPSQYYRWTGWV